MLNPEAVEAFEVEHGSIMASPSPSCESIVSSMPGKRKDIDLINTISGMIKKNTDNMIARFDKQFDYNERKMTESICQLEENQSQEIKEMSREIKKLQSLSEKIDELDERIKIHESLVKTTIDAQHILIAEGQKKIADLEKKIAELPQTTGCSPEILKKMDDIEQRQKNPSLLINGMNERHQNENGVLGLAYEILHITLGYTDLDEVINLGKN